MWVCPKPPGVAVIEEIDRGLENDEFFLEYMPFITLTDRKCVGCEALVRWNHPTNGVLYPGVFIPMLRHRFTYERMTQWVLDRVYFDLRRWLHHNKQGFVSINISCECCSAIALLIHDAPNIGLVRASSQVVFELLEDDTMDIMAVSSLKSIRSLGVRVALDDVNLGDGANLLVLAQCPFDILKLGMDLIRQIKEGLPTPEWVYPVEAFINHSSIEVIAEGVENEYQVRVLTYHGINLGQGYLFSKALPPLDFMAYYKEANRVRS